MQPLNPTLHEALCEPVRAVRARGHRHPRIPATVRHRPNWYRRGKLEVEVLDDGEVYKVSCPYCGDTRMRLCFCHRWGVKDLKSGDDMLYLVYCFNEHCIDTREAQEALWEEVFPAGEKPGRHGPAFTVEHTTESIGQWTPRTIQLPGGLVPINAHSVHPVARQYIDGRGFDVEELWKFWRVGTCQPF